MKKTDSIKVRWELIPVLAILLCVSILYTVLLPMGKSVFSDAVNFYNQAKLKENDESVEKTTAELEKQISYIDSMTGHVSRYDTLQSAAVVSDLYTLADSVKLNTSKIESGSVIPNTAFSEIPVVVRGQGEYTSMGKFVEGIENLKVPTRVRQITIKNDRGGEGELYLDFVIMSRR